MGGRRWKAGGGRPAVDGRRWAAGSGRPAEGSRRWAAGGWRPAVCKGKGGVRQSDSQSCQPLYIGYSHEYSLTYKMSNPMLQN
jgi:hypothetical protein